MHVFVYLCLQLERLQRENAEEWGKRERLETERLTLERENKKLKNQIKDLEDQLDQKIQQASTVTDKDMKTLQVELSEKNKVGICLWWMNIRHKALIDSENMTADFVWEKTDGAGWKDGVRVLCDGGWSHFSTARRCRDYIRKVYS